MSGLSATYTPGRSSGQQAAADVGKVIAQSSADMLQSLSGGPVAAAVAGVISVVKGIIQAVTEGKIRQADAVALAYKLKIPGAQDYPKFIVDVFRMRPAERLALRGKLVRDFGTAKTDAARKAATFQIATIDQLFTIDLLRLRGELPPSAPPEVLVQEYRKGSSWLPWVVGGTMVAAVAWFAASRG